MNSANCLRSMRANVSSVSNETSDSDKDSILSKLRRLKIEEKVISKSVENTSIDFQDKSESRDENFSSFFLISQLKDDFIVIKNLFEDIKTITNSEDNFEVLDPDEIKKDVLDLESKIKKYKADIEAELSRSCDEEQEIINSLNNLNQVEEIKTKRKVWVKPYNDIVLSPVKALMNSPFKCLEVQQYQEFMASSKNSCGGWIPYNHNIFQQIWKKYFYSDISEDYLTDKYFFGNFGQFVYEVKQKLPGITQEEIESHHQWYSKYVHLKERQQKALDKWKTNKKLMKNVRQVKTGESTALKLKSSERLCTKDIHSNLKETDIVRDVDKCKEMEKVISHIDEIPFQKTELEILLEGVLMIQSEDIYNTDKDTPIHVEIKNGPENKTASCHKIINYESVKSKSGFNKPTEQWQNRCNAAKEPSPKNKIKVFNKLRIPDWRLPLQN